MSLLWREIVGILDFLERAMSTKVTEHGVLIPKQWFEGIDEVEIRKEQNIILVLPVTADGPILELGRSGFITYPAFDKLRPNGRKTVRGDAEPVEASNHEPEVMKRLLRCCLPVFALL
jgi:hypothetical protein